MEAADYERWYETPPGRWIGAREAALIAAALAPRPGESLLDVGCGTGYFTRTLAPAITGQVTGVDLNADWIRYARGRDPVPGRYLVADARALPFADRAFDLVVSVTALCFIPDQRAALAELLRVGRRRFALGLLHRHSLLWWQQGRGGGRGGYAGAHWHTRPEVRALLRGLPIADLRLYSAIQFPGGGRCARWLEASPAGALPTGAFLLAAGDILRTGSSLP
ncbi:MAG: class I SAM-dependent methyltransferase [Gammaproteobacteria bacterium]|nr:class I SAM-dependent methyltransferase [Gammaproteobacteria bacterium]